MASCLVNQMQRTPETWTVSRLSMLLAQECGMLLLGFNCLLCATALHTRGISVISYSPFVQQLAQSKLDG